MNNLTVVVPFYNGHATIQRLIDSIPEEIPILIVDDLSDTPLASSMGDKNVRIVQMARKGYFTGAVNRGVQECETDVLVLNQDIWFENNEWVEMLEDYRLHYGMIGERIRGAHPAFGDLGYIHGTFMFLRRDALREAGPLNERDYPLWGSTAEYQWRVARKGYDVLPLRKVPGFHHERPITETFGSSIKGLLAKEQGKRDLLVRTPPIVSVVVPCYNYGRYLADCINSLVGGPTSLGEMPGQTFQSFEIIVVDDASTDNSMDFVRKVADIKKGIRAYRLEKNVGTARALNFAIGKAVGKYITFLSADDMREANSLEKLVEACEANPHSFAYDDITIFNGRQRIKRWPFEEYDFEKLIWKNQIHAGIMYPKQAWVDAGGYPPSMGDGREDWAFNIALGIEGWCGTHVHEYGYLYRREGQNRTEHNTSETHRERFLAKVMDLFPRIYEGHRPMACCGKGGNSRKNVGINTRTMTRSMSMDSALIGSKGMAKVEYLGEQMSFTITGDASQALYTFGKDRKRGWVDQRDLGSRESGTGFLGKRDRNGNWLYKQINQESSRSASGQEPELAPVQAVEVEKEGTQANGKSAGQTPVEPNIQPSDIDDNDDNDDKKGDEAPQNQQGTSQTQSINPSDYSVEELKQMDLSREQWEELYRAEMAGRNRKGAVSHIEELLANWPSQE